MAQTRRVELDARWGIFMDALDIGYRYKRDGHEQLGVTLRPRFFLPRYSSWLDVMERLPSIGTGRAAHHLASQSGDEVAFLIGGCSWPWERGGYDGWLWWRNEAGAQGWHFGVRWVDCQECAWRGLARLCDPCPQCWGRSTLCMDTAQLVQAYREARREPLDAWLRRTGSA
jgi:hypothetical protein